VQEKKKKKERKEKKRREINKWSNEWKNGRSFTF
jgi:hypothetical protein